MFPSRLGDSNVRLHEAARRLVVEKRERNLCMLTLCCNLHDLQRSNMTKTKTWKHESEWFHWNFTKRLCMSSRFRSKRHLCPWSFKIWRLSKQKIHRFLKSSGNSPNVRNDSNDRCLVFTAEHPRLGPKSVLDRLREKLSTCPKGGERAKVSRVGMEQAFSGKLTERVEMWNWIRVFHHIFHFPECQSLEIWKNTQ